MHTVSFLVHTTVSFSVSLSLSTGVCVCVREGESEKRRRVLRTLWREQRRYANDIPQTDALIRLHKHSDR